MQKEYRQKVRKLFCYSDNKILCCDSAFAVLDFDTDIILGSSAGSDLHGLSGAVCASLGVFGGGGLFVICRILIRRCAACCCACDGQCLAEGDLGSGDRRGVFQGSCCRCCYLDGEVLIDDCADIILDFDTDIVSSRRCRLDGDRSVGAVASCERIA